MLMRFVLSITAVTLLIFVGSNGMCQVQHPVLEYTRYNADSSDALKAKTAYLMQLSEEQLLSLVPTQAGFYFTGCPNCTAGQQEHGLAWDPKKPDQVHCLHCGQVYPSDKYPNTGIQEVTSPAGNKLKYPYWEDEDAYRYYFESFGDYDARKQLASQAYDMACAYHVTKETEYARRAALILNRFAEVFPDYIYKFDYPFRQKVLYEGEVDPKDFRGGFRTARWDWWAYMGIPVDLVFAYDMIYESGELEKIPGAKQRIENDFFLTATEQVAANRDTLSNMSPVAWRGMIVVARVLEKPEYIHEVVSRLERFCARQFYYDGVWREGAPSYHQQVIGGLSSVFNLTKGYSDPEGYTHPETSKRLDDLDLASGVPMVARVIASLNSMRLPNGRLAPVHDTWSSSGRGRISASGPVLLPALGHAILGRGQGDDQMQVHLTWSGGYGHTHYDGLSMLMFARGEEMLPDLGYTHTRYRAWTLATASHNGVVIDCENQYAGSKPPSDGALEFFDATSPDLQVVAASNPQAYPEKAQTYSRMLAMVGIDVANAYVVDAFFVEGGQQHDYFIHGSADRAQSLAVSGPDGVLQMEPVETMLPEGVEWKEPEGEHHGGWITEKGYAYGFLSDNRVGRPAAGVQLAEFKYDDKDLSTRVYLVTEDGDELYSGMNPQIRPAGRDDSKLEQFNRHYVMIRRAGGEEGNLFVALFEPVGGSPIIKSVSVLPFDGSGWALVVVTDEFTDIIGIFAYDLQGSYEGVGFEMSGPMSQLRIRQGEVVRAYSTGLVSYGTFMLDIGEYREAKLVGVERGEDGGALLIDADWTQVGPTAGTVLVLHHGDGRTHGYTVASVEKAGEGSRIITLQDPGFEYDADTQTAQYEFFPHHTHTGEHVVRWQGAVSYEQ